MFLKQLQLQNFRNYSKLDFLFKKPITVLIGNNAQGKTNFLESVYFLATAKSVKADRDEEIIKNDQEVLRVEGEVTNEEYRIQNTELNDDQRSNEVANEESTRLEIVMQNTGISVTKRTRVNGVARRVNEYSGHIAVVLFRPEDINLVVGSPSLRRYYIDQTLSQVDKNYKRTLSSYENIVTRKNKVLKRLREGFAKSDELDYWTDQQVLLGVILTQKRQEFFDFLNSVERKFGEYQFMYQPSEISRERLLEYQDKEILSASSLVGPHRDDFLFLLDERELGKYGSRGEQRTAVLDLKLAEVSFMEKVLGKRPILLLDDIFSELDESHRQHVIDVSKLQQTIISTVEFDKYLETEFKPDYSEIIVVKNGVFLEKKP